MSQSASPESSSAPTFNPPLDEGVRPYVEVLSAAGIETFESCEGGPGHSYAEPTVRFHGGRGEGFRALAIAQQRAFPVDALRRIWTLIDGEPTGPYWELTFRRVQEQRRDGIPGLIGPLEGRHAGAVK